MSPSPLAGEGGPGTVESGTENGSFPPPLAGEGGPSGPGEGFVPSGAQRRWIKGGGEWTGRLSTPHRQENSVASLRIVGNPLPAFGHPLARQAGEGSSSEEPVIARAAGPWQSSSFHPARSAADFPDPRPPILDMASASQDAGCITCWFYGEKQSSKKHVDFMCKRIYSRRPCTGCLTNHGYHDVFGVARYSMA
jgi:hypothetical protein